MFLQNNGTWASKIKAFLLLGKQIGIGLGKYVVLDSFQIGKNPKIN